MASQTPIYMDWQFWSAIAAVAALVLSQLPPIRLWFLPRKLDVEVHSRIQVTHKVGNPNIALFVSIRNTGGRNLYIRRVFLNIFRDGTEICQLPAQQYYETPSSQSPALFVPFTLKPEESWSHGTSFLKLFDRPTEKHFRESESKLSTDIRAKLKARPEESNEPVEADAQNIQPFLDLFNRLNIWMPGEYIAELNVIAEPGAASFTRKYRFTLYESDAEELKSYIDDYKYGGGLSYNVDRHAGLFVPITAHTDQ